MKTNLKNFRQVLSEYAKTHYESVDRAKRGEETDGEYHDEDEGRGVTYETCGDAHESVDRAGRGEEADGEYEDEDEGRGVTYESNLYTDADQEGSKGEKKLVSPDDCGDEDEEKAKSHAAPSEMIPAMGESYYRLSLKSVMEAFDTASGADPKLGDNQRTAKLKEETPPGREDQVKALKKDKDVDNPWAVSWASYNKDKNESY